MKVEKRDKSRKDGVLGRIRRESGIKNSFFKYYNIKFFESQVMWERVRVRFLVCELKGE